VNRPAPWRRAGAPLPPIRLPFGAFHLLGEGERAAPAAPTGRGTVLLPLDPDACAWWQGRRRIQVCRRGEMGITMEVVANPLPSLRRPARVEAATRRSRRAANGESRKGPRRMRILLRNGVRLVLVAAALVIASGRWRPTGGPVRALQRGVPRRQHGGRHVRLRLHDRQRRQRQHQRGPALFDNWDNRNHREHARHRGHLPDRRHVGHLKLTFWRCSIR